MLRLEHIFKSYGENIVLQDVSLTVADGEFVCLTGKSGCGKTTLMRIAAGLEKPDSGSVYSDGGRYSFCFQENRLLPHVTALDNMTAVCPDKKRVLEYLTKVGLSDHIKKYPDELSGGMKRRLALCRCLCYGGDVFFLDEPLRELDAETYSQMKELIKTELQGKTVLMITHSEEEAKELSDRVTVLNGELRAEN